MEDVRIALASGDPEAALSLLLTRWRSAPDPQIADAIDAVSAQVTRTPFTGAQADQWKVARHAAHHPDDFDLVRTLEAARTLRSGGIAGLQVLDPMVANWPEDPRFTTIFRAWLDRPSWVSGSSRKAWVRVFRLLNKTRDVRQLSFTTLKPGESFPGVTSTWIDDRRNKLVARDFPAASVTPEEAASCAEIIREHMEEQARLTHRRGGAEALLTACLATPDSLDLRRVLADALSELDDPHGEFILLQLADAEGTLDKKGQTRMHKLQRKHDADWLGPLHAVLLKGGREFRNGFLVHCGVKPKNAATSKAALEHPLWRTVERMEMRSEIGRGHRGFELATQRACAAAQHVGGLLRWTEVAALLTDPPGPLTSIGLHTGAWNQSPGAAPADLDSKVTDLDHLAFSPAWIDALPWFRRHIQSILHVYYFDDIHPIQTPTTSPARRALALLPQMERTAQERAELRLGSFLVAKSTGSGWTVTLGSARLDRGRRHAVLDGLATAPPVIALLRVPAADRPDYADLETRFSIETYDPDVPKG